MDDPTELVYMASAEEIERIEQADFCVTLYTLWDKLRRRGSLGERVLYTCRNDSPVPDDRFASYAGRVLGSDEVVVDHGEAIVLSALDDTELKDALACELRAALESL